jgi:hypothetical protein
MDIPALPGFVFEANLRGLLSTVVAILLPILAGLLMKASWSSGTKGFVLLVLAAVKVGVELAIQSLDNGVSVDVYGIVYATVLNFIIAVAMYYGILKGSGVQQAALSSGVKDKPAVR